MSRNSKNARLREIAKQFARAEGKGHNISSTGKKGPAKTPSVHGKKNAWWQKFVSYAAYLKGGKKDAKPGVARTTNSTSSTETVQADVALSGT